MGLAQKGRFTQAIGRSKGGLTTKIHAVVDTLGNPIRIKLTAGNVHDINPANAMITGYCSDYFHSDRANDADRLIHLAESQGSKIVIPLKSNRIDQREYDRHIYKERHLVECFFLNSKYFVGFQHIIKNWLKSIGRLFDSVMRGMVVLII
jgi:transposase